MYRDIPLATIPEWDRCTRCQSVKIEIFNHKHADLCDYFHFRNIEAPTIGYESIKQVNDTYYLKMLFELHSIPHRAFHISGVAGHYWDIWLPAEISGLLDVYNLREGYAGMSLEEYVVAIAMKEANERT